MAHFLKKDKGCKVDGYVKGARYPIIEPMLMEFDSLRHVLIRMINLGNTVKGWHIFTGLHA